MATSVRGRLSEVIPAGNFTQTRRAALSAETISPAREPKSGPAAGEPPGSFPTRITHASPFATATSAMYGKTEDTISSSAFETISSPNHEASSASLPPVHHGKISSTAIWPTIAPPMTTGTY
jgi:hypothetical protein